jgi:hypothetical protein
MEVSGQLHLPPALHWSKSPQYPLNKRMGGLHIRPGRFAEKKILLPLPGTQPRFLRYPGHSLVVVMRLNTQDTTLQRTNRYLLQSENMLERKKCQTGGKKICTFVIEQVMKVQRKSRSIAVLFL